MTSTGTIRNVFDQRLFDGIGARRHYYGTGQESVLMHYVIEARRSRWTWQLIADASGLSVSVLHRLYRDGIAWQSRSD